MGSKLSLSVWPYSCSVTLFLVLHNGWLKGLPLGLIHAFGVVAPSLLLSFKDKFSSYGFVVLMSHKIQIRGQGTRKSSLLDSI